ncbi:hypothetical protein VYU27_009275 [Nannochloropsis oceanica]
MRRHRKHHFLFLVLLIGACGLHCILVFERQIRDDWSYKAPPAHKERHSLYFASSDMHIDETLQACSEYEPQSTQNLIAWTDKSWKELVCPGPDVIPSRLLCSTYQYSDPVETLITILAGVSTRGVSWTSPTELAPFRHLLPSIVRTVECGFRYEVILGYDSGDKFYDTPLGQEVTFRWFQTHVQNILANANINIMLVLKKVENKIQKPGPVFNDIARMAYSRGADYLYRVNDDSEFLSPWAYKFTGIWTIGYLWYTAAPGRDNLRILRYFITLETKMYGIRLTTIDGSIWKILL